MDPFTYKRGALEVAWIFTSIRRDAAARTVQISTRYQPADIPDFAHFYCLAQILEKPVLVGDGIWRFACNWSRC